MHRSLKVGDIAHARVWKTTRANRGVAAAMNPLHRFLIFCAAGDYRAAEHSRSEKGKLCAVGAQVLIITMLGGAAMVAALSGSRRKSFGGYQATSSAAG